MSDVGEGWLPSVAVPRGLLEKAGKVDPVSGSIAKRVAAGQWWLTYTISSEVDPD